MADKLNKAKQLRAKVKEVKMIKPSATSKAPADVKLAPTTIKLEGEGAAKLSEGKIKNFNPRTTIDNAAKDLTRKKTSTPELRGPTKPSYKVETFNAKADKLKSTRRLGDPKEIKVAARPLENTASKIRASIKSTPKPAGPSLLGRVSKAAADKGKYLAKEAFTFKQATLEKGAVAAARLAAKATPAWNVIAKAKPMVLRARVAGRVLGKVAVPLGVAQTAYDANEMVKEKVRADNAGDQLRLEAKNLERKHGIKTEANTSHFAKILGNPDIQVSVPDVEKSQQSFLKKAKAPWDAETTAKIKAKQLGDMDMETLSSIQTKPKKKK